MNVAEATNIGAKFESAELFADALNVPMSEIVVDDITQDASRTYKANPER